MNADDQYVPDEMDARGCFLDGAAGAFVREDWEAFLARVRRDAAREALDGLADAYASEPDIHEPEFEHEAFVIQASRHYRDTHYPEETP